MWSARQFVLAAAFAALGGGAWWILRSQPGVQVAPPQRARAPDSVVSRFSAVETDDTGRPSRRLAAVQLRQFLDEDLVELDAPRLTLFETDGPPWEGQSRHGLLVRGGEEIRLSDAVQLRRAGSQTARSLHLATSELTIWPQREYAQGDRPVRIESDRDWVTATGIRLWYKEPARAELPGRVHLYLAPASAGAPAQESAP
jgi:lipopolysaccharide export system protein LptC